MADQKSQQAITLRIQRTFPAPREKIFKAWTDPQELKKWWGPAGYTTPSAEIDLRVGGAYRIAMRSPEGVVYDLYGVYRVVEPPTKLVYTWNWRGTHMDDIGETLVTVEFHNSQKGTEIILTHERFPDQKACDEHSWGWTATLDRLAPANSES